MEDNKRKPGSGGKREGAGRKKGEMPKVTRSYSIDEDLALWVDSWPGDKIKSKIANEALREYKTSLKL